MGKGPIPPLPPLDADEALRQQARLNCAQRSRARGESETAAAIMRGDNDETWAMRHEINKLRAEASAQEADDLRHQALDSLGGC